MIAPDTATLAGPKPSPIKSYTCPVADMAGWEDKVDDALPGKFYMDREFQEANPGRKD